VTDYRELLLGCGRRRVKDMVIQGRAAWHDLVTCDINPAHQPDLVWDLTRLPLPLPDDQFDEIHAYEVLEHTGAQGDYRFFFAQFMEFWRILKPGGHFLASVPSVGSPWLWGDPSHTRVILKETLVFLDQTEYTTQVGITSMSDFRHLYQGDFHRVALQEVPDKLLFCLRAIKPSRISA
jgi:SAM-dependent methyltransferase